MNARAVARVGNRNAFTILELLVVITILALLSIIAVTRLGGVYQRQRLETLISNWTHYDSYVRDYAGSRRVSLVVRVNLTEGTVTGVSEEPVGRSLSVPSSISIKRFISSRENRSSGTANVSIGPYGSGDSYAVQFSEVSGSSSWIVFSGITGQWTRFKESRDVEKIFHSIKKSRPDTH